MKKICNFLLILIVSSFTWSCNDKELIFGETPDTRMNEFQLALKQELQSAKYGWKAVGTTHTKGNFGYFFRFNPDGKKDRVQMFSDFNATTSKESVEGSYRIMMVNAPILTFETYSYIHMPADPDPSIMGGVNGKGFEADFEFALRRSTADTLFFVGRKYKTELTMVRATKEEEQSYLSNGYLNAINGVKDVLTDNLVSIFEYQGKSYQMAVNTFTRKIELLNIENTQFTRNTQIFSYSIDGLIIGGDLPIGDTFIKMLELKDNKLTVLTENGKKIPVNATSTPLLPITDMLGFVYKGFLYPYFGNYAGSNIKGKDFVDQLSLFVKQNFSSYQDCNMRFKIDKVNKRFEMEGIVYRNGTPATATVWRYDYIYDETTGLYQTSKETLVSSGSATYNMNKFGTWLRTGKFYLNYHFDGGSIYGKLTSQDGTVIMVWLLD